MLVFFRKRKEYREKGMAAMREEKTSAAFDCFQKACDYGFTCHKGS